jgi:hypothetical protein
MKSTSVGQVIGKALSYIFDIVGNGTPRTHQKGLATRSRLCNSPDTYDKQIEIWMDHDVVIGMSSSSVVAPKEKATDNILAKRARAAAPYSL